MKCVFCNTNDYIERIEDCPFCYDEEEACKICDNGKIKVLYCPICHKEDLESEE